MFTKLVYKTCFLVHWLYGGTEISSWIHLHGVLCFSADRKAARFILSELTETQGRLMIDVTAPSVVSCMNLCFGHSECAVFALNKVTLQCSIEVDDLDYPIFEGIDANYAVYKML